MAWTLAVPAIAAMASLGLPCGTALGADLPPSGATSCSGCHAGQAGTETPVPRLAGKPAGTIVAAMDGFRAGLRPGTVMSRIAKGFSASEIEAIAAWYAAQKD